MKKMKKIINYKRVFNYCIFGLPILGKILVVFRAFHKFISQYVSFYCKTLKNKIYVLHNGGS